MEEVMQKIGKMRSQYKAGQQVVYQWDQTIDEVNVYFNPPKATLPKYRSQLKLPEGVAPPKLTVKIEPLHLTVGIVGNPPFINLDLAAPCDRDESVWTIEDEQLHVTLVKANRALQWTSVFKGHQQNDPIKDQATKRKLLIERFNQQHPGFDFSNATINGNVPIAREYMGGMKSL